MESHPSQVGGRIPLYPADGPILCPLPEYKGRADVQHGGGVERVHAGQGRPRRDGVTARVLKALCQVSEDV